MASAHGLNEDGSPIPPHMRESGLLNMFPMGSDFPPPPPMGEFSRLLMQQGEKNMERMKELDRLKDSGHICSLCSNTFPDIVALQVHIIKSHGALPPGAGLEGILGKHKDVLEEDQRMEEDVDPKEDAMGDADITEREDELKAGDGDKLKDSPVAHQPFGFPLDVTKMAASHKPSAINDLLARQMMGGGAPFPGLMNPLLLGGGPTGPANQQFQGLFNMILSEMLKKVQKDTPPQTPPISPAHHEEAGREEEPPASRMEEATS